jgi:hypothetical protein
VNKKLYRPYKKMIQIPRPLLGVLEEECVPIYGSRRFGVLVGVNCIAGMLLVVLASSSILSLFPIGRVTVYYQLWSADGSSGKPTVRRWAQLNHTLVVWGDAAADSIFTLTMVMDPSYNSVAADVGFDDPWTYAPDDPAPQVLGGNRSWSGLAGVDLHVGETVTLVTHLAFLDDARYAVKGEVTSYDPVSGGNEGYHTIFYITMEQGRIVNVTDEFERPPPSATLEAYKSTP